KKIKIIMVVLQESHCKKINYNLLISCVLILSYQRLQPLIVAYYNFYSVIIHVSFAGKSAISLSS
ncbi:hypothetical protein ACUXAA_002569, partial [Staphylococcus cohnii]